VRRFQTHGTGAFEVEQLAARGPHLVVEPGVLVFRPEFVWLGDNVYLGHGCLLKAYPEGGIVVGDDCWIGPYGHLSGAARITIGDGVGIGPMVQILTSAHRDPGRNRPILDGDLDRAPVVIGPGSDIGAGTIIKPGVTIGAGVQVGAGAVVTGDLPDFSVVAGVPARILRERGE